MICVGFTTVYGYGNWCGQYGTISVRRYGADRCTDSRGYCADSEGKLPGNSYTFIIRLLKGQ